jgi:hypothetical protein
MLAKWKELEEQIRRALSNEHDRLEGKMSGEMGVTGHDIENQTRFWQPAKGQNHSQAGYAAGRTGTKIGRRTVRSACDARRMVQTDREFVERELKAKSA